MSILLLFLFCGALLLEVYGWSSVPEAEVNALHSLYLATNGDSWIYDVGQYDIDDGGRPWNFSGPVEYTDPCVEKWFGVRCTASAEECTNQTCGIAQLHMTSFNMQGNSVVC